MSEYFTKDQILNNSFHDERDHHVVGHWTFYYRIKFLGEEELLEEHYKGTPLQIAERLQGNYNKCPTIGELHLEDLTGNK